MHHLLDIAAVVGVIVQVVPAIAHPVNASGFLMADHAVWVEHAASGYVFTDEETVSETGRHMDNWRKSSYSDANGGNCVETASGSGVVLVRDTTNRDGEALAFNADAWRAFAAHLKRG